MMMIMLPGGKDSQNSSKLPLGNSHVLCLSHSNLGPKELQEKRSSPVLIKVRLSGR